MTRDELGDHIDAQLRHPQGGISERTEALLRLARKLGVEFHTGAPVKRIIVENGRAAGIELETGLRLHGPISLSS